MTKAVVGGVIANPYAGRHVADIQPMMKALEPLAVDLTERVMKRSWRQGLELEAYGKGAIVGIAGELEHAALWHQPSGYGIRHAMGGAKSIVPSTVKVASAGARIDIPLHHVTAAYVRSHFDAIELSDPLKAALAVLDAYMAGSIAAMRRRSTPPAISRMCGWPAARSSSGRTTATTSWRISRARAGDGWARSQWDERTPIHVGADKVHLKVKFSRWRADGSLIGRFETIYIVTLQDGHWGIQARSSFAS